MKAFAQKIVAEFGAQTVIETLEPHVNPHRLVKIRDTLARRIDSITVVLEEPYDPHNAAAIIRSAEAHGLTEVHLIRKDKIRLANSVTRGADKWMDIERHNEVADCCGGLRKRGFRLVGTTLDATDSIEDIAVDTPIALIFGNEHEGLSAHALKQCDAVATIPMTGFTQSLNLSVSAALAIRPLSERRRQFLGATGDLSANRQTHLYACHLAEDVRAAREILARHHRKRAAGD